MHSASNNTQPNSQFSGIRQYINYHHPTTVPLRYSPLPSTIPSTNLFLKLPFVLLSSEVLPFPRTQPAATAWNRIEHLPILPNHP